MTCDYPVVPIGDPFHVDDLEHYSKPTNEIGKRVQTVGADLLVTHQPKDYGNFGWPQMHQAATITECIEALKLCKEAGWRVVVASHGGFGRQSLKAAAAVLFRRYFNILSIKLWYDTPIIQFVATHTNGLEKSRGSIDVQMLDQSPRCLMLSLRLLV
ncbi:Enolase [Trema orientale]|uniref:phosphopyruvate hydratase n=1 Tax=Trema orientale TaxID=63057 RepID=A0A2P5FX60_TREOI|nr:Enolase [Trema orientale]